MVEPFIVASVSSNTNSFGLYGHILIALSGNAYQVGASSYHRKKKGEIVRLDSDHPNFARYGFEIPERLPDAPPGVVKEVWQSKLMGSEERQS